ncbi:hypothetical protein C1645_741451 [Glomus cerebriforme]|uniref:Uncharacterized protein n=1 Tax=Glomus cerebriforme TaxID=658196 RepID=A0A397SNT9_9GLOM|nr:hypothetical protein C1645_741451 [Glomus cerebriforme]
MVNAQIWLDANYPKEARASITELDISNKNLEGSLDFEGFTNVRKLDFSFNKITQPYFSSYMSYLEELNVSYNQLSGQYVMANIPAFLKKFDFSHNNISSYTINFPSLTHLNASNNVINSLDLHIVNNLVELDCSNNPLSNLTLNYSPDLISFNCLGVKLTTTTTITSPSNLTVTVTPTLSNSSLVTGLSITTGIFGLYFLGTMVIAGIWFWKRSRDSKAIPTPGYQMDK